MYMYMTVILDVKSVKYTYNDGSYACMVYLKKQKPCV